MRVRDKSIKLTVCIDRVAASGGYMMACVADIVVAAPFAIIGSIGVVAQVPNLHRLLKKHDVDFQEMTAGEFKRTVSVFGEITEKGLKKFQKELEDTHQLFKEFVKAHRPKLDIEAFAVLFAVPEGWARPVAVLANLGVGAGFMLAQEPFFEAWKARYWGPERYGGRYRPGRWGQPVQGELRETAFAA